MKKPIRIVYFFIAFLMVSCNSGEKQIEKEKPESESEAIEIPQKDTAAVVEKQQKELVTIEDYLADFKERKRALRLKLESCTPQFANQLYLDFRKENHKLIEIINTKEIEMLDDYEGLRTVNYGYDINGKYGKKIKKYRSHGLQFQDVGEGYTEIRIKPSEYTSLFSGRVTNDFEEYITNVEREDHKLITADAGLVISFHELSVLIVMWENHLKRYPKSSLKVEVKNKLRNYQLWYVIGLDNTPVVEYSDGHIYEENKVEFAAFKQWQPKSPTTQLINIVLANEGNFELIQSKVVQRQKELLNQM